MKLSRFGGKSSTGPERKPIAPARLNRHWAQLIVGSYAIVGLAVIVPTSKDSVLQGIGFLAVCFFAPPLLVFSIQRCPTVRRGLICGTMACAGSIAVISIVSMILNGAAGRIGALFLPPVHSMLALFQKDENVPGVWEMSFAYEGIVVPLVAAGCYLFVVPAVVASICSLMLCYDRASRSTRSIEEVSE